MNEYSLIKVKGKPIEKLIEVLSKGIGILHKPREIRKIADAEAYRIKVLAKAEAEAEAEAKGIELESNLRIEDRISYRETMRQINIESVTFQTAQQLENETDVSDEPLDDDWITRFFTTVQDISSKEMQTLWSRILAGEIKRPKSYSLRTLEFLRNLSKEDAELLSGIANYTLETGGIKLIYYKPLHDSFSRKWNLNYLDFLYLIELGIINANDTSFPTSHQNIGGERAFKYGNKVVVFQRKRIGKVNEITATTFTKIGQELLKLIDIKINEEYLLEFSSDVINKHPDDFLIKSIDLNTNKYDMPFQETDI